MWMCRSMLKLLSTTIAKVHIIIKWYSIILCMLSILWKRQCYIVLVIWSSLLSNFIPVQLKNLWCSCLLIQCTLLTNKNFRVYWKYSQNNKTMLTNSWTVIYWTLRTLLAASEVKECGYNALYFSKEKNRVNFPQYFIYVYCNTQSFLPPNVW